MYYNAVGVQSILNGDIEYKQISSIEFAQLSKAYIVRNSDTENTMLYRYIEESLNKEGHSFAAMKNRSGLNVFAALEELSEQLLTVENNKPVCIYGNLLRFREMTKYIEEDLLVCAYLAMRYKRCRYMQKDFAWNVTVQHNNVQLRRILEKGISENHFHLYGSAASFHLIWIELMNRAGQGNMLVRLDKEFREKQRMTREHYSVNYLEDSFAVRVLKAALLRACFIRYYIEGPLKDNELCWIKEILSGGIETEAYIQDIQEWIDYIKMWIFIKSGREEVDYALYKTEILDNTDAEYLWVSGERWLMYQMLKDELLNKIPEIYCQWFYAYLVIKQNIRVELIQTNDTVGFENFSIYNDRKGVYRNYDKMIESAVYGSVENGNIKSLEIRITPGKSAEENVKRINDIESVIQNTKRGTRFPQSAYYFVFHFTKCEDADAKKKSFEGRYCRHYKKRCDLVKQANGIARFRESYRQAASRVLGIDACSQEIGCRPEVFAVIFRFLTEHFPEETIGAESVKQLRMTYHVGEDFLDIVDGLRAVDEAVRFLNLKCGDRIGHGTVLGIDVKKWYQFKHNTILITQQDYLDNIVWLYHKLREYEINGFDILRDEILKKFDYYFSLIYSSSQSKEHIQTNIHTYYEAWKLRGDDPELYVTKRFDKNEIYCREWIVNRKYPEEFENREREEVSQLYYMYHYDEMVRRKGQRSEQIFISPTYVEAVVAVQKVMQKWFAMKGICIETNPSSNLAISTINGYEEHPIVQMYNKDLTWDREKLEACSQINVSINTDDKGVFHTSLENEYALMACALEKVKDEKGNNIYNRQMVYQWIDNIREMGNLQAFREK